MAHAMKCKTPAVTSKRSQTASLVRPAFGSTRVCTVSKTTSSAVAQRRQAVFGQTSSARSMVTRVAAAEAPASNKTETKVGLLTCFANAIHPTPIFRSRYLPHLRCPGGCVADFSTDVKVSV